MRWPLLFLSMVFTGCALNEAATAGSAGGSPNACSSDSSCPDGGRCTEDGFCAAREGRIDKVLLAVTPRSGDWLNQVLSVEVDSLAPGGIANPHPLEIVIPARVRLVGEAKFLDEGNAACDRNMRVLFSPVSQSHYTETGMGRFGTEVEVDGATFDVDLKPGTYEFFAEPIDWDSNPCLPVYSSSFEVQPPGTASKPLLVPLTSAGIEGRDDVQSFRFDVVGDGLEGWTFKLLEPTQGRIVSNEVVLSGAPTDGRYPMRLYYHHAGRAGYNALAQWILAEPPPGSESTALVWWRNEIADSDTFEGVVRVPASDSLRSVNISLAGIDGALQRGWVSLFKNPDATSFATTYEPHRVVEPTGVRLRLSPGSYRLFVMPDSSDLQARAYEVTVSDSPEPQALTIELAARSLVSGQISVPTGDYSPSGLPIFLDAAPTLVEVNPVDNKRNLIRPVPAEFQPSSESRGSVTTSDGSGAFAISADTGESVFSIRAPASSGLPWHVRPGVSGASSANLGRIEMPLPLVYSGQMFGPDGKALEARVEAYVYVDEPGAMSAGIEAGLTTSGADQYDLAEGAGIGLIRVGETRSGPDGRFTLLLPPQLY